MVGLRRIRVLPATLVALVLVSAARAQAQGSVDFGFYPDDAQDCLYEAADSSRCGNVPATNACLCRNGGDFITTAAACLGRSNRSNLREVYRIMRGACDHSDTPITITEDEWNEAAKGETSTTSSISSTSSTTSSTGTATTTSPPTPTGDDDQEEEESTGLSTGAMAGVIAGAIGGFAVLGAVAFLLFRRRRKLGEESHPMLPQYPHPHQYQHHHISMAPSGRESTAYYGSPPTTAGWPKKDWGGSPDLRQSSVFNWESPAHLAYPGGALAPSPPLPIQELDGAPQYPLGSTEAPVEMGGTPIAATPPPPPPQPQPPPPANTQYQPYQPPQQYPGPGWSPQQR